MAAETAARHVAVEAGLRDPGARSLPDSVLTDLNEARLRWLEVLGYLSRMCPTADEEAAPLILKASEQAFSHGQYLVQMSLRLLHEMNTDPSQFLRVWIGTLAVADDEEEKQ